MGDTQPNSTDAEELKHWAGSVAAWRRGHRINIIYERLVRRALDRLRRSPDLAIQQAASAMLADLNAAVRDSPERQTTVTPPTDLPP